MNDVIGDTLPLALGVAISPIPIIAAILMLLSPRARSTSLGFLLGWVLGILIAVVIFTLLASVLPEADDTTKPVAGTIKIILGAFLLVLATKQWWSRPTGDAEPALPHWMEAIDTMTAGRALVLGFLLSGLNPKNLLMGAAAGITIGSADLTANNYVITIAVYTVVAASTVAIPVIAYLFATEKMAAPLASLRTWLMRNNSTVMAVLLLVIGVVLIGKGVGNY